MWKHDIRQGFNDSMVWWPQTLQPCNGKVKLLKRKNKNVQYKEKSFSNTFIFMLHGINVA